MGGDFLEGFKESRMGGFEWRCTGISIFRFWLINQQVRLGLVY